MYTGSLFVHRFRYGQVRTWCGGGGLNSDTKWNWEMKLILHVFLYCVFCGVSGIQYIAQVHIAFLNTALNVWQSSCPCLLKTGITDVNCMADIHFKQEFSRFILAILFQSPLPTPPSFSTIIRATDAGWLGYAVPAFAVLLIGNCIDSF